MTCSNKKNHTSHPAGYAEHSEWAQQHARRHEQTRCPSCNLWAIWVRRPAGQEDYGGEPELYFPPGTEYFPGTRRKLRE